MNQIIAEPSKKEKIDGFLRTCHLIYVKLGQMLEVSNQGGYKILNAYSFFEDRLKQLKELGRTFLDGLLPDSLGAANYSSCEPIIRPLGISKWILAIPSYPIMKI